MPDTAGSDNRVPPSLRGIVRTASRNKQHRFRDLYRLINAELLTQAWAKLNKSAAIADDDITVKAYETNLERNIEGLVNRLRRKSYRAKLVKRRYISKEIGKWLKAGILEPGGYVVHPVTGTPQGGIVSPILANIYLHVALDQWFQEVVKPRLKGRAIMCRYADDWVCAFQYRYDARRFYSVLPKRLARFNLEVEPSKTRIIRFSRFHPSGKKARTFAFLGFEFYWFNDRKGIPRVKRRTAPPKQQSALRRMKAWLKKARHLPKRQFFKSLKSKLRGHYNYYYVRGNSLAVWSFYSEVIRYAMKWLNRRSQRKSYNWEKFKRVIEYVKMPKPKATEKRRMHQVALG